MQTLRLYLFWKVPDVFLLDTILLDSLALNLQSILQKHDKNLKIKVEEVKVQSGHCSGAHRSKITKKVHKPPQNYYIEWPVFSDIGLNFTRASARVRGEVCEPFL